MKPLITCLLMGPVSSGMNVHSDECLNCTCGFGFCRCGTNIKERLVAFSFTAGSFRCIRRATAWFAGKWLMLSVWGFLLRNKKYLTNDTVDCSLIKKKVWRVSACKKVTRKIDWWLLSVSLGTSRFCWLLTWASLTVVFPVSVRTSASVTTLTQSCWWCKRVFFS